MCYSKAISPTQTSQASGPQQANGSCPYEQQQQQQCGQQGMQQMLQELMQLLASMQSSQGGQGQGCTSGGCSQGLGALAGLSGQSGAPSQLGGDSQLGGLSQQGGGEQTAQLLKLLLGMEGGSQGQGNSLNFGTDNGGSLGRGSSSLGGSLV